MSASATSEPEGGAIARLPARLDTLSALRLPALIGQDDAADAAAVEEIGFAALQWLAAERIAIVRPSPAFVASARDAGLGAALLGEPEATGAGRRIAIRFADSALDFGREPLFALAALRGGGAMLAARPRDRAEPAPDTVAFDIVATLSESLDDDAVAAMLGAFEDAYTLDPVEPPASPPAAPAPTAAPTPAQTGDGILVADEKLARLMALADELASAQAGLAQALGAHRAAVGGEIGEVDRLWRILQSAIADLGAAPIADLIGLPTGGWRWEGAPVEIERAVMAGIAAPLRAMLPGGGGVVSAVPDGGFVRLTVAPAPAGDPALGEAVAAVGGRIAAEDGTLALRLPRSLSLIDALVVEIGAGCYALPVAPMIEALRPEPHMLHHLGPGRALLRFGEAYVPIVAVGAAFAVAGWQADPTRAVLIVADAPHGRVALLVDAIVDQQQVTVKPVDGGIGRPRGTLGAAIVRGNRVALVIDVAALDR